MDDAANAERSGDQAVTVVLAEFQALRAEMVSRSSAQAALIGIGLTAIGVILGFVVKDKGNSRLLLALPPITALVNVLWSIESRRVVLSGAYIRNTLWPYLRVQVRDETLPCWEDGVERRRSGWSVLASLVTDGLMIAMFAAAGAVALIVVANSKAQVPGGWLAAEWVVVALSFILPLGFALTNRQVSGSPEVPVVEVIEIARGIEEVWQFVSDPSNDSMWCPKVRSVERAAPDRWRVIHKPVPLRPAAVLTIERLSADPPHRLAVREEDEASVFEVEYRLEQTPTGTRFTQASTFRWKKLSPLLHGIFAYGVRRDIRRQLRNLRRVLEAS